MVQIAQCGRELRKAVQDPKHTDTQAHSKHAISKVETKSPVFRDFSRYAIS